MSLDRGEVLGELWHSGNMRKETRVSGGREGKGGWQKEEERRKEM